MLGIYTKHDQREANWNNNKTLMEYYHTIIDCIVALSQLNYTSDLLSSDILRQVIKFGKGKESMLQLFEEWPPTVLSPNSCFEQVYSKKHHTNLHDAFQKVSAKEHQADPSITIGMSTDKSNEVYLQIVPVLTSNSAGKRETTYALLDTWSQSTLIREDFAAELKLHGNKTKIKTSSIKDQRQSIIVHEVD